MKPDTVPIEALCRTQQEFPGSQRVVFINAWNEWAEGCHLEPNRKHRRGFLEATLRAKSGRPESLGFQQMNLASAGPRPTLSSDLAALGRYHGYAALRNLRNWLGNHPRLRRIVRRVRAASAIWFFLVFHRSRPRSAAHEGLCDIFGALLDFLLTFVQSAKLITQIMMARYAPAPSSPVQGRAAGPIFVRSTLCAEMSFHGRHSA